ncbi:uncharacterized protein [Haliotis cracherodii]|uniref:uncharacterized protein isoform X2 n=1 Tax=Haliotis cracherodii TaxID=6455 RepID=UPI0039EC7236
MACPVDNSEKTMADIELTGIRSRDPDRPTFDSSQEGLLSAETQDPGLANGNGHIQPESEAFLGLGGVDKPTSVSVFKRPRRKWWILVIIIFLVAILILAVFVGVFFSVSKGNEMRPATWLNSTTINASLVVPPPSPSPSPTPKPPPELYIQKFQSFMDSSSSKLFEVTFSNGTTLRTFGHKGMDGSFHSLFSISVGDAKGSDLTHIQFKGENNFASVMLPDGTIVSYDWTHGFKSLECKVFSVTKPGDDSSVPLSHIVTLPLGTYSEIFVRISKGLIKPHVQSRTNVSREECNSRLPLRVTKCGGQYTYHGSFIQGLLTTDGGPHVMMDALPWPTTQDNCHENQKEMPNYFLPLPLGGNVSAEKMKESFCSSGTNVFINLCLSIEGSDTTLDHDICTDVARTVKNERDVLYNHIYGSCFKIFHSIRLTCVALKVSSSKGVSTNDFHLSKLEIYQSLCMNTSSTLDVLRGSRLVVGVTAYCPSVLPLSSYQQHIYLNQSNPGTLQNMIRINCPSSPEVTRFVLGHKYIGPSPSGLSKGGMVDHILRVCATCAFGTKMEVEVTRDDTCCYNNCTRAKLCEIGPNTRQKEMSEFDKHSDMYCHQFLAGFNNTMPSVDKKCVSGCKMEFSVNFKLYNTETEQVFYHQTLTCDQDNSFSCKRTFGR